MPGSAPARRVAACATKLTGSRWWPGVSLAIDACVNARACAVTRPTAMDQGWLAPRFQTTRTPASDLPCSVRDCCERCRARPTAARAKDAGAVRCGDLNSRASRVAQTQLVSVSDAAFSPRQQSLPPPRTNRRHSALRSAQQPPGLSRRGTEPRTGLARAWLALATTESIRGTVARGRRSPATFDAGGPRGSAHPKRGLHRLQWLRHLHRRNRRGGFHQGKARATKPTLASTYPAQTCPSNT